MRFWHACCFAFHAAWRYLSEEIYKKHRSGNACSTFERESRCFGLEYNRFASMQRAPYLFTGTRCPMLWQTRQIARTGRRVKLVRCKGRYGTSVSRTLPLHPLFARGHQRSALRLLIPSYTSLHSNIMVTHFDDSTMVPPRMMEATALKSIAPTAYMGQSPKYAEQVAGRAAMIPFCWSWALDTFVNEDKKKSSRTKEAACQSLEPTGRCGIPGTYGCRFLAEVAENTLRNF